MEMNKEDYLKKALLDTQEKVRDFMLYAEKIDDEEMSGCFRQYATEEGRQAQMIQKFIDKLN